MNIIEKNYNFGAMDKRKNTRRIIMHHAAAQNCTADDVHRWHKARGWAGIGYHFFIRKDGSVYRGRPENTVGAHAGGENYDSIGICFEGNFETETVMPEAQRIAGAALVAYLKKKYGITKVQGHRDVNATACPGRYFPFDAIANGGSGDVNVTCANCAYGAELFVRDVQQAIGAEVDGVVGEETESKLPTISEKDNHTHPAVKALQVRLFALGYLFPKYGADGDFGTECGNAVEDFQRDHGLDADRIVGKNTWAKLMED